jgi:heavy metal translocating P-type ATPase
MATTVATDPLTEKNPPAETGKLVQIKASGMMCSFCTMSVERALGRLPGVNNVQVNLVHGLILVDRDPKKITAERLEQAVESLGYTVVATEAQQVKTDEALFQTIKWRGFLALGLAVLDLLLDPLNLLGRLGVDLHPLFGPVFSLVVALVVLTWVGFPILRKTLMAVGNRVVNANVLLSTGAWGAFAIGAVHLVSLLRGDTGTAAAWPNFFPIATWLMALHLFFGYFKLSTRKTAAEAVRKLLSLQAQKARVIRGGQEVEVPAESVAVGEIVVIRPGERVPLDGAVAEGSSSLDMSTVTGESAPVFVEPGAEVIGGTTNLDGFLKVRATRVGEETFLNQVVRLMRQIEERKPPVMLLMDRLMNYYGPVVFIAAALAGAGWFAYTLAAGGNFAEAVPRAIYVALTTVIMGYPCALGITTPMVLAIGGGKGIARGLLVKAGEFFQELSDVDTVVFDKTGTLTYGKPTVKEVLAWGIDQRELLALVSAAEKPSEHPLGKAMVRYAQFQGVEDDRPATDFRAVPGQGLSCRVGGEEVLIGKKAFLAERGVDTRDAEKAASLEADNTVVYVATAGRLVGAVALQDVPRRGAQGVMKRFEALGLKTAMLTGDSRPVAESIARQLGIDEVYAELLPAEKVKVIEDLQKAGRKVAMVGDGVNDAPALVQSDVGIALGAGTDVAMESAGVVLVSDRIDRVLSAILLGRASHRKMRQNIAFAVLFNVVGMGLAVAGLITPVVAIAVMTLSIFAVLINTTTLVRTDLGVVADEENTQVVEAEIRTPGMVCEGCASKITEGLLAVDAVQKVVPDVKGKRVRVRFDPKRTSEDRLRERVKELGYA